MFSLKEVAKFLNVSYYTVYRLVAEGKLGAYKIRGIWRVPSKELEDFLTKNHSLYIDSSWLQSSQSSQSSQRRIRLKVIKRNF